MVAGAWRLFKSKHSLWDEKSLGWDLLGVTLCMCRIGFHTCIDGHHELKHKTQLAGLVPEVSKAGKTGEDNWHSPVALGLSIRQPKLMLSL